MLPVNLTRIKNPTQWPRSPNKSFRLTEFHHQKWINHKRCLSIWKKLNRNKVKNLHNFIITIGIKTSLIQLLSPSYCLHLIPQTFLKKKSVFQRSKSTAKHFYSILNRRNRSCNRLHRRQVFPHSSKRNLSTKV